MKQLVFEEILEILGIQLDNTTIYDFKFSKAIEYLDKKCPIKVHVTERQYFLLTSTQPEEICKMIKNNWSWYGDMNKNYCFVFENKDDALLFKLGWL